MKATIVQPDDLKNTLFDRVIKFGDRFSLSHHMNDIISISIINPWSSNLQFMSRILMNSKLRIIDRVNVDKLIHLVGLTPTGTTFEIKLWPTVIYNWSEWSRLSCNSSKDNIQKIYENAMKTQECIDKSKVIR